MNPEHPNPATLVSGATGFIGRQVVRELIARGRPVMAMARPQHGLSGRDRETKTVEVIPDGGRARVRRELRRTPMRKKGPWLDLTHV